VLPHQELVVVLVLVFRCSPLPDTTSDLGRRSVQDTSDQCLQLAAWHLESSSICTTVAKSVPESANQSAADSCAAAVQFAVRRAMV
jgi:hypothetical protein